MKEHNKYPLNYQPTRIPQKIKNTGEFIVIPSGTDRLFEFKTIEEAQNFILNNLSKYKGLTLIGGGLHESHINPLFCGHKI